MSFGFRESESLERVKVSDWEKVRVSDLRVKFWISGKSEK